jgi:hypothetical protein
VIRLAKLVWEFVKVDFHFVRYALTILLAAGLLIFNYSIDLENSFIDRLPTNGLRFLGYLALYTTAYYIAVLIGSRFGLNKEIFKNKLFWITSALGLAIFSIDSGFVFHQYVVDWISLPAKLDGYIYAILSHGIEFITITIPLFLVNKFLIRNSSEKLGLNAKEIDLKPFFLILVCIAPFIFFSAFEKGLSNYYPTFRYPYVADYLGISEWVPVALFEFAYGLNFFNVELFFRGFFVIGLTALLGREAVLPMAALYCTIHFGKPELEAVSSFFGGYILGAITYQTRSIWGGVIVHVGLAWMMELAAFIVKAKML